MISKCNCIKSNDKSNVKSNDKSNDSNSPDMLEDGNCICTDCNCHSDKDEWLQKKLRNYGIVILGTSTALYGIYLLCCEKHLHILIGNT